MAPRAVPRRRDGGGRPHDTWTLELEPRRPGERSERRSRASSRCSTRSASARCRSRSAATRRPGRLVHTVRAVGAVTRAICALEPGDDARRAGPVRQRLAARATRPGGDVVIVAGGHRPRAAAAASSTTLLEHRERLRRASLLLYGARTPERPALHGRARGVARAAWTSRSTSRSTAPTRAGAARSASCRR